MSAIDRFASLVSDAPRDYPAAAVRVAGHALIDTVACIYAGSTQPVATNTLAAIETWSNGNSPVIGRNICLSPPFAALVNGAAAHALDYDDFDAPANAHPSAVIFPALLAMAAERPVSGLDLLDAYILGVEIMQRLGEAMNMDHYRRGWLSTLTLGTIGAAGACARLGRFDQVSAAAALSLAASMASGLTNQGGYQAKQMNPGFAANNGVMAAALAAAGISASSQVIDGPISIARSMGDYDAHKFEKALEKLANPWSILEHGLIMKAYPSCGYTHRVIDAAIDLHARLPAGTDAVSSIRISIPDYYLDLLVYAQPQTPAEAMFSAEYNVAAALARGVFGFDELNEESIGDAVIQRLRALCQVDAHKPLDEDIVYDPRDPDSVELTLSNGQTLRCDIELPTGAPAKPMSEAARRAKFDTCLQSLRDTTARDALWTRLNALEAIADVGKDLAW